MLQQGTPPTLLGATNEFFAGGAQLVAGHGREAGRGRRPGRRSEDAGALKAHRQPRVAQRRCQREADAVVVFRDAGFPVRQP